MRREEFRNWLEGRISKKSISDCLSRCTAVEHALGVDLDSEFYNDKGQTVIKKLMYTAKDVKLNVPAPTEFNFKEGSNIVQRLVDLRSAVKRYFDFCQNG